MLESDYPDAKISYGNLLQWLVSWIIQNLYANSILIVIKNEMME